MKKTILKLTTGLLTATILATSANAGYTLKKKVGDIDTKLTFFGFAQLDAIGGKGMQIKNSGSTAKAGTNFGFRAQRIRLGWKYISGKIRGKVFIDFNQKHDNPSPTNGASVPHTIKDAFISYKFSNAFIPKVGVIKMPNGMGFTMPGWNLDIAERGFDKKLVLERNLGFMISGRGIGYSGNKVNGFEMGHDRPWKGFGYDVMIANQASRSGACKSSKMGGKSYALRGMYDYTEKLHLELSFAKSENADGKDALTSSKIDYKNINFGIDSNLEKLSLKAEYTNAKDILGINNWDEKVYTATAGYFVKPNLELVAKHIQGTSQKGSSAVKTKLGNTYIGFNLFLSKPHFGYSRMAKKSANQHKIVFNYVKASGSGAVESGAKKWSGLGGYRDDAFILQYQFKF